MAASAYYAQVQQLYVAYFGRPADKLGLEYYAKLLDANKGNDKAMLHDFANSAESKALYNQTSLSAKVASMYQTLFGREGDIAGITYWASEVQAGKVLLSEVAAAIAFNAQATDKAAFTAKIAAADAFTAKIDTTAELVAYETNPSVGRTWLSSVKDAATQTSAAATIDATLTAAVSSTNTTAGQTFTLTTTVDTVTGTLGNDTFSGYVNGTANSTDSTLTASDRMVGGEGVDTLNVTTLGTVANVFNGADVTGVEVVAIRNTSATTAGTASVSATGLTGGVIADRGTGDITVTNLANGVAFSANSATGAPVISQGYVATATNAVTNLSGSTLGTVTLVGAGIVDATINTSGTASTTGAINLLAAKTIAINAGANLTAASIATTAASSTLTVKGAATSVNVGLLDSDLVTVDATGLTAGGLTATIGAAGQKVTGGAGNDNITTLAAGTLMTTIIDAGTGTDTLTINGAALVDSKVKGAQFKGFDILAINSGAAAGSQDVEMLTSVTGANAFGAAVFNQTTTDAVGITNMNATMAANVTLKAATGTGAITFGIKDATINGNIDTLKIVADDGVATTKSAYVLTAPNMAGVENLEITSNETSVTISALTSATGLTSTKLAGSANYDVTTGAVAFALNTVFDASAATGTVKIDAKDATTTGLNIKGSLTNANTILDTAQADVITGGTKQDIVTLKGGNDIVTLGGGADDVTLTAFGTNNGLVTFKFAAGDSMTTGTGAIDSAATGVTDKISGVAGAAQTATVGSHFVIDNGLLSSNSAVITFGAATAPTMGTTAVAAANAWFVNVASATSAFAYQDTNGNSKIDSGEFAIELVGTNLNNADFTIASGKLTFIGAA